MSDRAPEEQRIREAYARREREIPADRYALFRPYQIHVRSMQLGALARALTEEGVLPFGDRSILELGCGAGQWLVDFESMGAQRDRLAGVDLDASRIEQARARLSERRNQIGTIIRAGADLRAGSAAELPWPDQSFDIVFQSTLFTSIIDRELKRAIAREMTRVVKRDGLIVWYDFRFDNPFNPDVRGVKRSEIEDLFSGWRIVLRKTTLVPPLARRVASASPALAAMLEGLNVLNTHYLGTFRLR